PDRERREAEDGRDRPTDHERAVRAEPLHERGEDERAKRQQQDRAEAVDARYPSEHLARDMPLDRGVPEDLKADQRKALDEREEKDGGYRAYEPEPSDCHAGERSPRVHGYAGVADAALAAKLLSADLGRSDAGTDSAE